MQGDATLRPLAESADQIPGPVLELRLSRSRDGAVDQHFWNLSPGTGRHLAENHEPQGHAQSPPDAECAISLVVSAWWDRLAVVQFRGTPAL